MNLFGMIAVGVALAMDVSAVSMVNGMIDRRIGVKKALVSSASFGFFQGGFLLIGYVGGTIAFQWISGIDHWVAFGLLLAIGGKMVLEAFSREKKDDSCVLSNRQILAQSVATSIDAMAVGIGLVVLNVDMVWMTAVVAAISFLFGLVSLWIGRNFGVLCGKKPELVGGLILIGIGVNLLIGHLME